MATLLLATAASTLTAGASAWVGLAAGVAATAVGRVVDSRLFGRTVEREGSRLSTLEVQTSSEGADLPAMAGRLRLGGQVIWATNFREEASTTTTRGGKGGAGRHQGRADRIQLLRQLRRGLVRRSGPRHRPHLGGGRAARRLGPDHAAA